jgi:hypothetical protein
VLPKTRAECLNGPRPCPHVRCKYHLGDNGSRLNCSLDIADSGPTPAKAIGAVMGMSRMQIERIVQKALDKFPAYLRVIMED